MHRRHSHHYNDAGANDDDDDDDDDDDNDAGTNDYTGRVAIRRQLLRDVPTVGLVVVFVPTSVEAVPAPVRHLVGS